MTNGSVRKVTSTIPRLQGLKAVSENAMVPILSTRKWLDSAMVSGTEAVRPW